MKLKLTKSSNENEAVATGSEVSAKSFFLQILQITKFCLFLIGCSSKWYFELILVWFSDFSEQCKRIVNTFLAIDNVPCLLFKVPVNSSKEYHHIKSMFHYLINNNQESFVAPGKTHLISFDNFGLCWWCSKCYTLLILFSGECEGYVYEGEAFFNSASSGSFQSRAGWFRYKKFQNNKMNLINLCCYFQEQLNKSLP